MSFTHANVPYLKETNFHLESENARLHTVSFLPYMRAKPCVVKRWLVRALLDAFSRVVLTGEPEVDREAEPLHA